MANLDATKLTAVERRALVELQASDPAMADLIERHGPRSIAERRRDHEAFEELVRIIVAQQVSTSAARSIWGRICAAHGERPPTAAEAEETLRGCGLSGRKASYVVGIAGAFEAGRLDGERLRAADDDQVVESLTGERGLGRWSAEMFLMFHLGRPDIFSGGDLGLRNGARYALGLEQVPSPEKLELIAERWRPQRTLAAIYLWEAAAAGTG